MDIQLQNWHNFCRYHATGDWYGIWTKYSSQAEIIDSFQCVRSLIASDDSSEIYHQNHYTYADGKKESKTFGPYKKPIARALFLDNSFSWGSSQVESGANFGFETGFRYEDRRASVVIMYNISGNLDYIIVIPEHLATFSEEALRPPAKELTNNWQGTQKKMTPDLIVSPPVATAWKRLEDLGDNYLTLNFSDGISISCPRQVESGKKFLIAVDWLINSALLQRGIRDYDAYGFTSFNLELFSSDN